MKKREHIRGQAMHEADPRNMRRRQFSLVVVLLFGSGLLAVSAWRHRSPSAAEATISYVGKGSAPPAHSDTRPIESPVVRTVGPTQSESRMSRTSDSLESSFERLAAEADSGDRVSSCVLSRALALCGEAEKLRQKANHWIDVATRAGSGSSVENLAISKIGEIDSKSGNASDICRGLSPDRQRETVARMFQAAELGDPRAMAHFALYSYPPEKDGATREQFDDLYRKHAVAMLERSASMGNLRALRELYIVYLHGISPNRDAGVRVEKDPVAAIAIGTALLGRVSAREKRYLAATMDQIEDRVDALHSARYASLQKKYSEYVDRIAFDGFEESGKNLDIRSCGR